MSDSDDVEIPYDDRSWLEKLLGVPRRKRPEPPEIRRVETETTSYDPDEAYEKWGNFDTD